MTNIVAPGPLSRAWQPLGPAKPEFQTAGLRPDVPRNPTDALSEALSEAALSAANGVGPLSADALSEALGDVLTRVSNSVGAGGGAGGSTTRWAELDRIKRDYQVRDDEMTKYKPNLGPIPIDMPFVDAWEVTRTEAKLLDRLQLLKGAEGLVTFYKLYQRAHEVAEQRFPTKLDKDGKPLPGETDGHRDAFRHAYWNALMARHFGQEFAEAFGTAHEGRPNNPASAEAMDLYNNELGRRIAQENPGTSDEQLADLVEAAVRNGEALVIGGNGELAYSDEVAVGETGKATDQPVEGGRTPREDPNIYQG